MKALLLPTTVFSSNKRGYPVLSKRHQDLIATFFKLRVQVGVTNIVIWNDHQGAE